MFNAQDFSVWCQRWQTLDVAIGEIPIGAVERATTLEMLRQSLQGFAQRQFLFFLAGFSQGSAVCGDYPIPQISLEPSIHFPVDYVFTATLEQIKYDLELIRRASEQRLTWPQVMKDALKLGDCLAQLALEPAMAKKWDNDTKGLIKTTAVLTYFQKLTNTRLIPYAPASLIGIPETVRDVVRDYLAIPHEAGHFVYRNGKISERRLEAHIRQQLNDQTPAWVLRWLEEIFADVYGALVGGPAMAIDFQDILLDNRLELFLSDDGEHPVAALRPRIYNQVLRYLGFGTAADKLDERWDYWLAQRGQPTQVYLQQKASHEPATLSLVDAQGGYLRQIPQVETVVSVMLALLAPIFPPGQGATTCWTKNDLSAGDDLINQLEGLGSSGPLYGQFEAFVQALDKCEGSLVELQPAADQPGYMKAVRPTAVEQSQTPADLFPIGRTGLWLDALTDPNNQNNNQFPVSAWLDVLSADGWTIMGPENDSSFKG